ncbi:hypothetical protein ISS85_01685 [Candidatus Microgenomates bacterium]|nr:hypothetical protein [Candidatus Microgenomates bacterium]
MKNTTPKNFKKESIKVEKRLPLSEKHLKEISTLLYNKYQKEERKRKYAPVKEVLTLLARAGFLAMALVAPNTIVLAKELFPEESEWKNWKRYNPSYLKSTLARLEKQKEVKITEENDQQIVKLTTRGKVKLLKYTLKELKIKKPKRWDGRWRLIMYDIPKKYKTSQEFFRTMLNYLSFYPFQRSVYLFPHPCEDEIEYLRQILGIDRYVRILIVEKIEHDEAFRTYFGLT